MASYAVYIKVIVDILIDISFNNQLPSREGFSIERVVFQDKINITNINMHVRGNHYNVTIKNSKDFTTLIKFNNIKQHELFLKLFNYLCWRILSCYEAVPASNTIGPCPNPPVVFWKDPNQQTGVCFYILYDDVDACVLKDKASIRVKKCDKSRYRVYSGNNSIGLLNNPITIIVLTCLAWSKKNNYQHLVNQYLQQNPQAKQLPASLLWETFALQKGNFNVHTASPTINWASFYPTLKIACLNFDDEKKGAVDAAVTDETNTAVSSCNNFDTTTDASASMDIAPDLLVVPSSVTNDSLVIDVEVDNIVDEATEEMVDAAVTDETNTAVSSCNNVDTTTDASASMDIADSFSSTNISDTSADHEMPDNTEAVDLTLPPVVPSDYPHAPPQLDITTHANAPMDMNIASSFSPTNISDTSADHEMPDNTEAVDPTLSTAVTSVAYPRAPQQFNDSLFIKLPTNLEFKVLANKIITLYHTVSVNYDGWDKKTIKYSDHPDELVHAIDQVFKQRGYYPYGYQVYHALLQSVDYPNYNTLGLDSSILKKIGNLRAYEGQYTLEHFELMTTSVF